MATDLGITSQSQTVDNLVAGGPVYMALLVDAAATAAVGQVLQYDATGDNYVDFTAGITASHYVVCAEAKTLSGDTNCLCIVAGEVRMEALDATAQADAEIKTALAKNGIFIRDNAVT